MSEVSDRRKDGTGLKCVKCGNEEVSQWQHVEDIQATRSIYGFDEHGTLIINGYYESESGMGGDEWLECGKCHTNNPLPDDVDYS